jgi:hypothetical protein
MPSVKMNVEFLESCGVVGKKAYIYDTYEHAIAFGDTGLVTGLHKVNKLTGADGDEIVQSKTDEVGVEVDMESCIHFNTTATAGTVLYGRAYCGKNPGPFPVVVV